MPQSDLPLAELRSYAPDLAVPTDLQGFWSTTLAEARAHDLSATFEPVENGLALVSTFDVSYVGRLVKLIRESGAEVIHSHSLTSNVYGSIAGRWAGVPPRADGQGEREGGCWKRGHGSLTGPAGSRGRRPAAAA